MDPADRRLHARSARIRSIIALAATRAAILTVGGVALATGPADAPTRRTAAASNVSDTRDSRATVLAASQTRPPSSATTTADPSLPPELAPNAQAMACKTRVGSRILPKSRVREAAAMTTARPSRTAQGVAAERAVLANMGVITDPFSRSMLTPLWTGFVRAIAHWPGATKPGSVARAGLGTRIIWHDAQVVRALEAGIDQVVTIGAGYDSRAWRFRRDGVRFFELDHRATQQDKIARAPAPGPIYVEADLTHDDAAAALVAGGLDAAAPALFIIEGVTMYLAEATVRDQLATLARSSAPGSRITIDFHPPHTIGTSRDRRLMRVQRMFRAGSGETFHLLLDRPHAVALVESSGWDVDDAVSLRDAAHAFVPPEFGLPVDLVSEHKTLIAATHH